MRRRDTTADNQGKRFWEDLQDFELTQSHQERIAKTRGETPEVDTLFEDTEFPQESITDGQRRFTPSKRDLAISEKVGLQTARAGSGTAGAVKQSAWKIKKADVGPAQVEHAVSNLVEAALSRRRKAEL